MTAALLRRFERAWAEVGCRGDAGRVGREVLAAWAEAGRVYHGTPHLEACLALFDELGAGADRPAELELALFFHDAVYDTRAVDNEQRSAAWARDALGSAGAARECVDRVAACISATRLSVEAKSPDAQLLVDLDRAILGADSDDFDAYERAVREEYAWVEDAHYAAARVGVLERFLAQTPIFRTAACAHFEGPARANLARSIQRLGAGRRLS